MLVVRAGTLLLRVLPSKLLPLLLPAVLCRMLYDIRRGGFTSRRRTAVSSACLLSVVVLVLLLASAAKAPDCAASGRCSAPAAA